MALNLPVELLTLTNIINESPESLTTGNAGLRSAALIATKFIFDLAIQSESQSLPPINGLLSSFLASEAPQTRSQTRAKRNGRLPEKVAPPPKTHFEPTPLPSLLVEDIQEEQIWEQLDLRGKWVCQMLKEAFDEVGAEEDDAESANDDDPSTGSSPAGPTDKRLANALKGRLGAAHTIGAGLEESSGSDLDDSMDSDAELGEAITELRDESSSDGEERHGGSSLQTYNHKAARRFGEPSPVDDEFFDLAAFNAETEGAEARNVSKGSLGRAEEDGDSDGDENDGETLDYFKPVDEPEHFDEEDLESGGGELYYKDFFEPPPRIPAKKLERVHDSDNKPSNTPISPRSPGKVRFHEEVRVRNIKPKGKQLPVAILKMADDDDDDDEFDDDDDDDGNEFYDEEGHAHEEDEDVTMDDDLMPEDELGALSDADDDQSGVPMGEDSGRHTMARLKADLFGEDDADDRDLTTHEKRLASLKAQITELEAENVAEKKWTLVGEASSRSRPKNSLLEEDLDFERVTKPVPLTTQEVVQGLEERIKSRITEGRFDDVVRLRDPKEKPFLPSRLFELKDTKSEMSLAQIYESEFTAAQQGDATDVRDAKLQKEHEEIERSWENICGKLDALCNAHFVPKQPKMVISTVTNASTTTVESALPTTTSARTLLAPEEIFTPSSSDPRARSELAPNEKRTLRNKMKKSNKKRREAMNNAVDKVARMKGSGRAKGIGGVKKQKEEALQSVVKIGRGVTVVGKKVDKKAKQVRKR